MHLGWPCVCYCCVCCEVCCFMITKSQVQIRSLLLVVGLELFLLVPSCLQGQVDSGYKTADQYWADTGLGSKELESLLTDESCYSSQQTFLACVNSISTMAVRFSLVLNPEGQLRSLGSSDILDKETEKKELNKWIPIFHQEEVLPLNERHFSFQNLWKNLDENFAKPAGRSGLIASGINGFLSVYKDPHSYIMPMAMYDEVVANSESRSTSVGFVAKKVGENLVVRKVLEGSPAAAAGFRKGDEIIAINGDRASALLPVQISELFRMRSSYRLDFDVLRKSALGTERKRFVVLRSETSYASVNGRMLEGFSNVGLITIHKFAKGVCNQTRAEIQKLMVQNMRGLMLDLRDNPGGQVEEAACISNLFLERGTFLFETRYMDPSKVSDHYVADSDITYRGPLVVLINSGSASASEIVAGVLKDQGRAKLVGERSFGKGSFQDGKVWGANSKIALFETQGLYYFASGWTPQLVGLEPDIKVNFASSDDQREAELYLNPITPLEVWGGPQSLSWLTEKACDLDAAIDTSLSAEDPQMQKAQALLSCGELKHDRHGSL